MKTKAEIIQILNILESRYPFDGTCFLHYQHPWQLLVATILSAQCTDARVNQVTQTLFKKYPSLEALAQADLAVLAQDIRSTGFFHTKSKNILHTAQLLLERHQGELPSDIPSLTALPGVGRKTANVVRGHIFNIPSVVVDTHVKRITCKLGLTQHKDPEKIEEDLMAILPKSHWIPYNQQVISHGRAICTARNPKCGLCPLLSYCTAASIVKS